VRIHPRFFYGLHNYIKQKADICNSFFLPRDACISAVYVVRCLSVRALRSCSVCIVTGKHILKLFSLSGSHTTIVFRIKPYGNIPTRTSNLGKNRDLRPISCLLVECRLSSLVSTVEYVDNGKRRFRLQQSTVTPKRTEQNLFVRIGTSEAEVTNNKSKTNNALEVLYY